MIIHHPAQIKILLRSQPIEKILNHLFGKDGWHFDKRENLYIVTDPGYQGEGFGFIAVKPTGDWFRGVVPKEVWQ